MRCRNETHQHMIWCKASPARRTKKRLGSWFRSSSCRSCSIGLAWAGSWASASCYSPMLAVTAGRYAGPSWRSCGSTRVPTKSTRYPPGREATGTPTSGRPRPAGRDRVCSVCPGAEGLSSLSQQRPFVRRVLLSCFVVSLPCRTSYRHHFRR